MKLYLNICIIFSKGKNNDVKNVCSFFIMKFLRIKISITSIKQNSKRFKNVIVISIFRRSRKLKKLLKNVFFLLKHHL